MVYGHSYELSTASTEAIHPVAGSINYGPRTTIDTKLIKKPSIFASGSDFKLARTIII